LKGVRLRKQTRDLTPPMEGLALCNASIHDRADHHRNEEGPLARAFDAN
jgi:hypothetical protein